MGEIREKIEEPTWENRWWQIYFHYYTSDDCNTCTPDDIAALADEAITVARKHLEGER